MTSPGLAMSRSIGDGYAHILGCSSEPEINNYIIHPKDKILVLGTDGIFEHLSNLEIG
jgi:serine/threonine protein phosphatase PrpC